MNKFAYCFAILLILITGSQPCHAAKVKAYVNRFAVSLAENREELKLSLQTLLMSRLNSDEIQAVENQADAEIQVVGSYVVFGTVFSLDALIKTSAGVFVDRVFVQGDSQNDLIPAVAEMAKQLRQAILTWNPAVAAKSAADKAPLAVDKVPAASWKNEIRQESKPSPVPISAVKKAVLPEAKPVTLPALQQPPERSWVSHRLPETLNGIAIGRTTAGQGVELFITGERYLRYYLKTKNMQFLSAVAFTADEKIIGVDVADLDKDEVPEVYVTILKDGLPVSQVYIPENNLLKKVADNLPYMLRSIALEGKEKKIFAQKINASGNFSGDVYELKKSGDNFTAANPMQLPVFGNIYNFNKFSNAKGEQFFLVGHPDGYLLVYSNDKKQLWKSRYKFGGSEAVVCQPEKRGSSSPSSPTCNSYLPQRLLVTKAGDIFVARNTGLLNGGATRNYTKNNVVKFFWDGVSLREKWRTGQSRNYLADYCYEDQDKELLLLEVEPMAAGSEERGSRVVVNEIE